MSAHHRKEHDPHAMTEVEEQLLQWLNQRLVRAPGRNHTERGRFGDLFTIRGKVLVLRVRKPKGEAAFSWVKVAATVEEWDAR